MNINIEMLLSKFIFKAWQECGHRLSQVLDVQHGPDLNLLILGLLVCFRLNNIHWNCNGTKPNRSVLFHQSYQVTYRKPPQPPSSSGSAGSSLALHDLQLSQLNPSEFTPLTEPVVVFEMDLACSKAPIPLREQNVGIFFSPVFPISYHATH